MRSCGKMAIQIMLKRKIKGKRKKYKSLKEMPDDLRQALEKTLTSSNPEWQRDADSSIIINGKEYSNIQEMPPDIRVIYEKFMKSLKNGKIAHDPDSHEGIRRSAGYAPNSSISYAGPGSIEPQSSFSSLPRWLIYGLVFIAAFIFLYFIIYPVT
jgi:hypothetical protein